MALFEYECPKCKIIFEWIAKFDEEVKCPLCWDETAKKIFPTKSPSFKLTYNPQKDMVDWDGNRSKYWDDWKKDKTQRIPQLDGDG